jgi:5-methylcytosine-specific restriction endonuclease McrA
MSPEFAELYKDPRWEAKRRQIIERDKNTCQRCLAQAVVMHVHHKFYKPNAAPWEYDNKALILLCALCHEVEHGVYQRDRRLEVNLKRLYGSETFFCLACGSEEFKIRALTIECKICGWDTELNNHNKVFNVR